MVARMKTLLAFFLLATAAFANDANRLVGHWDGSGTTIYNGNQQAQYTIDVTFYANGTFHQQMGETFSSGGSIIQVLDGNWTFQGNTVTLTPTSVSYPMTDDYEPNIPDMPGFKPFKGTAPVPAPFSVPVQFLDDNHWNNGEGTTFIRMG